MALRMIRGTNEGAAAPARPETTRPRLRLVNGEARRSPRPHVVAEVLSDGTVRNRDDSTAWETGSNSGWRQGSLSGDGWTLWWERRPWSAA
jgi:hypothetical protein